MDNVHTEAPKFIKQQHAELPLIEKIVLGGSIALGLLGLTFEAGTVVGGAIRAGVDTINKPISTQPTPMPRPTQHGVDYITLPPHA